MKMAELAAELDTDDDLEQCAFWWQVERERAAPVESGATTEREQEPTK